MRILLSILVSFLFVGISNANDGGSMAIVVDAGEPQTLCFGETLNLDDLGASISGDVSDGMWFTMGDGLFLPGNGMSGVFSLTDQYQPGPEDLGNGGFTLILVSDDPDGSGPMVEVSDQVSITFMNAPALVCNSSINISLAEACEQEVDVFMLLANPAEPYDKYLIELFDEQGESIPNNLLTVDHLGMDVTFTVGHSCTNSTCSGEIEVSDNIPPFLNCFQTEADCEYGVDPEVVGLPIPFYATATSTGAYSYSVENLDACGMVILTYQDTEVEMTCASTGYVKEITRAWFAEDETGNSSSCTQIILVNPLPLSAVMSPPDYDGTDELPLSCDGDWEALDNGYPSPESTGMPSFPDCGNIDATYSDVEFEECGAGFKVVRQWFVIDWCTSESFNENQIIKILDKTGPVFDCPEDLTLSTQPYDCISKSFDLMFVDSVYDCSAYDTSFRVLTLDTVDVTDLYINSNNVLSGLPLGEHYLLYVATDVCGNASQCTTLVTVIDDTAPFAVCDGYTQIALGSNGVAELFATSIDDESFDNCGSITMEIAKMTDECGWGLDFGPKAHFCCSEVGDTVLVAFRVTDEVGLSNTCMVSVFIEDKLPPSILCPTNITIDCDFDYDSDDLSVFGSVVEGETNTEPIIIQGIVYGEDGYFEDNCEATVEEDVVFDLECGAGTITRTFTATDLYGQSASCVQTITIITTNPFLESDINWPNNFEMNGCDTIQADPLTTGEPTWDENKCALVASTYEDQIFYISGGACIKILREWTVIDWCQYDSGSTTAGIWTYLQEIKLKNNIAPEFVSCADQDICSYDEDCTSELITFTAFVNDDCTDSLNLLYLWNLDYDDDGIMDESGQGVQFERTVLFGTHRVFWTVEDGCGNSTTCDYAVTVRDCKNPTPYCNSSITTTIMPSAGMIQIWAQDYDYGSYDNCTAQEDLIFSFSQNINDDNRVIVCEDIENGVAQLFTLELWVTDEYGNQERCEVSFIVQDNADACPNGTIKGKIAGRVRTQRDKNIPEVELEYTVSIDTFSGMEMTDEQGEFTLEQTPEFLKYVFSPSYETSPNAGVSTLDLVMMQQHILGIKEFNNPYDIIASDVNDNDKVSSSDLLTMRKMILGIIAEWPKEIENWVFVDSAFVFDDETYPFNYPDSIVIENLLDTAEHVNFVAVKMGDVNGSYKPGLSGKGDDIETRTNGYAVMDMNGQAHGDGSWTYTLRVNEEDDIDGLQFSMYVPEGSEIKSNYIAEGEYVITNNEVKVSWVNTHSVSITNEAFLEIHTPKEINIHFSNGLSPEVYINLVPVDIVIDYTEKEQNELQPAITNSIHALENPFYEDLRLNVAESYNTLEIEIFDVSGARIYQDQRSNGPQSIQISSTNFKLSGMYFIRAIIDGVHHTMKVVRR
ncbi:MAG: T9SS type A sorting domain-containing protein [Saprospiraceae bacterium]|nr:T9SS type A sorting domain-containing protein [Saprospiraceae bacterium]